MNTKQHRVRETLRFAALLPLAKGGPTAMELQQLREMAEVCLAEAIGGKFKGKMLVATRQALQLP